MEKIVEEYGMSLFYTVLGIAFIVALVAVFIIYG